MAVDVLLSKGVPEERILFLNLIASPEGAAPSCAS
jgi:uracil phosphoribosyltransferase